MFRLPEVLAESENLGDIGISGSRNLGKVDLSISGFTAG